MVLALGGACGELCVDAAENSVKPPHTLCLRGNALNKPRDKMRGLTVSDAEATGIRPPPPGLRRITTPPRGLKKHIGNWAFQIGEKKGREKFFVFLTNLSCVQ